MYNSNENMYTTAKDRAKYPQYPLLSQSGLGAQFTAYRYYYDIH